MLCSRHDARYKEYSAQHEALAFYPHQTNKSWGTEKNMIIKKTAGGYESTCKAEIEPQILWEQRYGHHMGKGG